MPSGFLMEIYGEKGFIYIYDGLCQVSMYEDQKTLVSSYACISYFKLATDLHASLQIVHAGELSDKVAGMTNLASTFFLNTLIKSILTISKFLMAL